MKTKKTFKREVALLLFIGLFTLAFKGEKELVEILTWPTYVFGALSFGLDWFGKSGGMQQTSFITSRGRPKT